MSTDKFEASVEEQRKKVKSIIKQRERLPDEIAEVDKVIQQLLVIDISEPKQLVVMVSVYEALTESELRDAAKYFRNYHRNLMKITDPELRNQFEAGHIEAIKQFNAVIEKCRSFENRVAEIINDEDMEAIRHLRLIVQPVECDNELEKQMPERRNLSDNLDTKPTVEDFAVSPDATSKDKKRVQFPQDDSNISEVREMKTQYLKTGVKKDKSDSADKKSLIKIKSKYRNPFLEEHAIGELAMPAHGPVRKSALKKIIVDEMSQMREAMLQRTHHLQDCLSLLSQIENEYYRQAVINKVSALPDGVDLPDKTVMLNFINDVNSHKHISRELHQQLIEQHGMGCLGSLEEKAFHKAEVNTPPVAARQQNLPETLESRQRSNANSQDNPIQSLISSHRMGRSRT